MNQTIKVEYFAILKDFSGKDSETITIAEVATPKSVFTQLSNKYGFLIALNEMRVAVNDEFSTIDHPLKANDKLVFIPPVAGG